MPKLVSNLAQGAYFSTKTNLHAVVQIKTHLCYFFIFFMSNTVIEALVGFLF